MHIIILGGSNDEDGHLDFFTKKRCDMAMEIIHKIQNKDIKIHLSGGYNSIYNKMKNNISHSQICKKYIGTIIELSNYNIILHEKNNCTVDEAINFGYYFRNNKDEKIFITNDWHLDRVEYLFYKTLKYYNINGAKFIGVKSECSNLFEENKKIDQLVNYPYGKWKNWLSEYTNKFLYLRELKKCDSDGKIIVKMRNENNEFFFNTKKFYWEEFKEIFYNKYFSNDLPPYFIIFENEIIGFIGCKTIEKNKNDIGIMLFRKYHGKGFGNISLKKFLKIFNDKYNKKKEKIIISQILKTNIGSYKIFLKNNFKLDDDKSTKEYYYLTYK